MNMETSGTNGATAALSQEQKDNSVKNLQEQVANKQFTDEIATAKQLVQNG
jgi:hypothetical protein